MGIITQGLMGGIAAGADTYAGLMVDQIKTDRMAAVQTERDKAQAIREQSLAEFRQGLHDKSTVAAEQRKQESTFETDVRTAGGQPVTTAEAIKLNKTGGLTSAKDEKATADADARVASAETKAANDVAIAAMRAESALKIADMRYEQAKEIAKLKATGGSADDIKRATLELKKAEEQRKNAQAATKLLRDNMGELDGEQLKIYNKLMAGAGEEGTTAPAPKTEEPPKKGIIATTIESAKKFFSKDEKPATSGNADPKKADIALQLSAAVEKINKSGLSLAEKQRRINIAKTRANSVK